MKAQWLVIGNDCYEDNSIDNVSAVANSVQLLVNSLAQAYKGTHSITYKSNLRNAEFLTSIDAFFDTIKDDTVAVFYYCGHGYRRNRSLYLAAKDSIGNRIENSSVDFEYINECIQRHHVRYAVLILDCCYSGAANGLSVNPELELQFTPPEPAHVVCITSCRSVEEAQIIIKNGQQHAAFTFYFATLIAKGLKNRKHYISMLEIYNSLKKKFSTQMPTIKASGGFDRERFFPNVLYDSMSSQNMGQDNENTTLNVLLVKTAIDYPIKDNGDFGIPLGLWLIKSYLQRTSTNIHVDIYDERLCGLQGDSKTFEERIEGYDVVGVSMSSCEVPPALKKLRIAKEKGKITIAGGIFVYSNEEYLLSHSFVDFVIPGVGTYPFGALLNELRKRIEKSGLASVMQHINDDNFDCFGLPNVFCKNNCNDAVMWEAATMPHVELDIWDELLPIYSPYINGKVDIYTSRGCNKTCSFCSVQRETKHNVILCNQDSIIRTIDHIYKKGIKHFSIKDEDFFMYGQSRVRDILSAFIDYEDISFKVRARIDTMIASGISSEELKRYHICEIQYGVESPSSDLRKFIQKSIGKSNEEVINLFNSHYDQGIIVNASFILGLVGEDRIYYDALKEFIQKIYRKGFTKVYLNFNTPHPTKSFIPKSFALITNDLKYFTHKIPVGHVRTPQIKAAVKQKMLATYEDIVQITDSRDYNPPIPEEIKELFTHDNHLTSNEIMKYEVSEL